MGRRTHPALAFSGLALLVPVLAWAQSAGDLKAVTLPNLAKLEAESRARPAPYNKIGSHLLDAIRAEAGPKSTVVGKALPAATPDPQTGNLPVHIKADVSPELLGTIQASGGTVDAAVPDSRVIAAHIPAAAVTALAGREDVSSIELSAKVRSHADALPSAQDKTLPTDLRALSQSLGVTGEGFTVCVIATSLYDGPNAAADAKREFDLDMANVRIVENRGTPREGEGLAMLEVIHAIAPKSNLMIDVVPGDDSVPISVAIRNFVAQGCNIIVDDLIVYDESPFGGGFLEKDVLAASQAGLLYFGAAGDNGNSRSNRSSTWEGPFTDGGVPPGTYPDRNGKRVRIAGKWNVFTVMNGKRITLLEVRDDNISTNYGAFLYWSDSPSHIVNNYHLYVVGGTHWESVGLMDHIVGVGNSDVGALSSPVQSVDNVQPGDTIMVVQQAGSQASELHLEVDRQRVRYGSGGATRGHANINANTVFSIGAIRPPKKGTSDDSAPVVEAYSSDGPRLTYFGPDGAVLNPEAQPGGVPIHKPDLVATDQLPTTARIIAGAQTNGVFSGTSAAAPQAAAIAALLLSCKSKPSADAVATALRSSARRISTDEFDPTFGHGSLVARDAADRLSCSVPAPRDTSG